MVPTFETRAIEALKAKGYRITSARISVLRTLEESAEPLSAQRIFEKMQLANIRIDVVSVYRVLSVLASVHLVHHVGVVDGYVACRMADEHTHATEHVVCRECGRFTEATMPDEVLTRTIEQAASLGFEAIDVKLEIMGVCKTCKGA